MIQKVKHLFFLMAALLCSTTLLAHDFEVDGIYYNIISSTDLTVSVTYKGNNQFSNSNEYSGTITIPASVTYNGQTYSVTSIGDYAFSGCSGLTSVTIPNSVTSIGAYAFKGCTGLTSITIPNSVTSIGDCAFEGCTGLTSITIPNSVTSIGYKAFYNCTSLTNITIPNSVTSIGNYAFYGCNNLTSLAIPNGVTSIGDYAFYGCKNLTSLAIPNGVKSINSNTFSNCLSLKFVIIPKSVNYINSTAFYNSNTGVVINFSALSISKGSSSNGYVAFYAKKVVNVSNGSIEDDFVFDVVNGEKNILVAYLGEGGALTLPANYKGEDYVIGGNAFSGNTSITSIQIPSSITSIGVEAFDGCSSLTSITIPNSVTSIGYKAFNECTNLTNIMIPNSVTSIGDYAFYDCVNLKTVINFSGLSISKSSSNNGYVAYYADNVINASNGSIEDDFVFSVVGEKNILTGYLGEGGALTLPADYRG